VGYKGFWVKVVPVLEAIGIVIPHPAAANPNSPAIIHFTLGLISRTPPYTLPLVC
jgi:hypothetical protein